MCKAVLPVFAIISLCASGQESMNRLTADKLPLRRNCLNDRYLRSSLLTPAKFFNTLKIKRFRVSNSNYKIFDLDFNLYLLEFSIIFNKDIHSLNYQIIKNRKRYAKRIILFAQGLYTKLRPKHIGSVWIELILLKLKTENTVAK